jgi:hypothetical protein
MDRCPFESPWEEEYNSRLHSLQCDLRLLDGGEWLTMLNNSQSSIFNLIRALQNYEHA